MTQQIYSLPRLTASVPLHAAHCADENSRAGDSETHARSRIRDPAPEAVARGEASLAPTRHAGARTSLAIRQDVSNPLPTGASANAPCSYASPEPLGSFLPDSEKNTPGLELAMGLEPVTCGLQIRRSTS